MKRIWVVLVTVLIAAAACATDDGGEQAEPTAPPAEAASTIEVTLQEWAVLPSPNMGAAGEVTFEVSNTGEEEHEFVVVRTDFDPGELPTTEDGSVDEDAVDVVGEVEELEPDASDSVSVALEAGSYALICNLVDSDGRIHYRLGMRTGFTVE